jgi:hypothetical protein
VALLPLWPARLCAVVAGLFFHGGTLLTMELGPFPYAAMALWLALAPRQFWDAVLPASLQPAAFAHGCHHHHHSSSSSSSDGGAAGDAGDAGGAAALQQAAAPLCPPTTTSPTAVLEGLSALLFTPYEDEATGVRI